MFKITPMKNFKSGQYISQGYYKSFQPEFINRQLHIDNMEVMQLLSQADRELGDWICILNIFQTLICLLVCMF